MSTPTKPLHPPVIPTTIDPKTEYVSGGGVSWLAQYLATLPPFIDDVTRDFGDDLYDRMMRDPQIASSINTIKNGILANGVSLPAVTLPTTDKPTTDGMTICEPHADQPLADEIAAFCQRLLDNLDTPLHDVLWNMLDALAYGHKVAEKIYGDGQGEDAGKLVLIKLKVKPRRTTGGDQMAHALDKRTACPAAPTGHQFRPSHPVRRVPLSPPAGRQYVRHDQGLAVLCDGHGPAGDRAGGLGKGYAPR